MFNTAEKLPVEIGDRVAAITQDGKVAKGRVVEVVADVAVFVTFVKDGAAIAFGRDEVMLLYRPVTLPSGGKGVIPIVVMAATSQL